ncbi:hypothetical protein [uncultured Fretibacterium sp.]|uniref:hypothetical protein n=1 Tax=uncultured Fretibacterium sp. TaxID=1678694 RepID=UPI00325FA8DA
MFIITRSCRHEDRETAHLIPKIEELELQLGNPGFDILRVGDLVHEKDKMGSEENLQFGVPKLQVKKKAPAGTVGENDVELRLKS